jgi:hypothetical protein
MAVITNYATLLTAVADYLARDNLTTFVPNFIQNTENKLYRSLNLRNEETALSVAISSGVAVVPTDYKKLRFAYYNANPVTVLDWMTIEDLYREWPDRSGSDTPNNISREALNFVFGAFPADGTLTGVYYAKQGFARDVDTTWYVTEAPEVLLYGALLEATPFIQGDERILIWQQLFKDALDTLRVEEDESYVSGGQLLQRAS